MSYQMQERTVNFIHYLIAGTLYRDAGIGEWEYKPGVKFFLEFFVSMDPAAFASRRIIVIED